jgi:hypothetical protein
MGQLLPMGAKLKQYDIKVRLAEDVRSRLVESARANSRSLNGEINFHLKMAMGSACSGVDLCQSASLPET